MHIINVGPISNNPQTIYTLVFGHNVSGDKILDSLKEIAKMREKFGFTTEANTVATVKEAQTKLTELGILQESKTENENTTTIQQCSSDISHNIKS